MRPTFSRVALTLAFVPSLALSQRPNTADSQELVPRELAVALMSFGPGMSPNSLLVGKAPDDLPLELIPPGAEILGGLSQFETKIVVLGVKQSPDSAISSAQTRLIGLGWTEPPPAAGLRRAGFVAAEDFGSIANRPDIVCRGAEVVTLSATYRRSGGSILKLSYSNNARYSACNMQQSVSRSPYDAAPVPTLRAPMGSISRGSGMGSSSESEVQLTTKVGTRLKPSEVVAHYNKQMIESGWTSVSEGAVEIVAVHTYRKTDDKGQAWVATLVSQSVPDGTDQDVSLKLTRRRP
jgi:hypothetical protein